MLVTITDKGKETINLWDHLDSLGAEITSAEKFALVERLWPTAKMLGIGLIQAFDDCHEVIEGQIK